MADNRKKADPRNVPLGSGLAARARSRLAGRRRQIDDAVDEAVLGRRRDGQTTDRANREP